MTLLERDEQRAVLARALEPGRTIALIGPPGVGRTVLLTWAAEQAAANGLTVWAASGTASEQDLAFGILQTLLPGRIEPAGRTTSALFVELLDLITAHAATHPLAIFVDDVQWADAESMRFLRYLQRRITGLNSVLILAVRTIDLNDVDADVAGFVAAADVGAECGDLSFESVTKLVPTESAQRCFHDTGGNPQLVALTFRAPDSDSAGQDLGAVTTLTRTRLDRCSPAATAVAQALMVFDKYATLARIFRLARLDPDAGHAALRELVVEGLLTDQVPIRFRYPVYAAALRSTVGAIALARMHAAAASLLAEAGEVDGAADLHAHTEPACNPATVAVLRRASELALRRADPLQASRYLTRALAEPPEQSLRSLVGYELGRAESRAGLASAVDHLRDALEGTDDPLLAAHIALVLSETGIWSARWEESLQALDQALAVSSDPATRDALALQIAVAATGSAKVRAAAGPRIAELRQVGAGANPALRAALAIEVGMTSGPAQRVIDLASSCLPELDMDARDGVVNGLYEMTAAILGVAGDDQAAIRALDAAVAHSKINGNVLMASRAHVLRGFTYQRWGRPREAIRDLRAALEIAGNETFNATQHPAAAGALIDALLDIDGAGAARAVADELAAAVDVDASASQHLPLALARVALAEHRPDVALTNVTVCRTWEQGFGGASVGFAPWRPLAVRAHLMDGDHSAALALAAELNELADEFGSLRVRAGAAASQALVDRDPELMGEAVRLYTEADHPVRTAEALLDLALMRRALRQERPARESIRAAIAWASGAGAEVVAERARRELRSAGGRLHREPDDGAADLTPAELRATRMAASGLTNKEIALATFLSHRTVEMHLSNAYRKLGVAQRGELAAKLATLGVHLRPAHK